ncbi:MAG: zinc ribbon domain-containing protein [Clostridiales bacterium]|jgi:hypothetical protein|nr:zinc ribbon domain-containing protein [Clostridiales bacterium]
MKLCSKCGARHADNAAVCDRCGARFELGGVKKALERRPSLVDRPSYYESPPSDAEQSAKGRADYHSIGGWLLFFIIICALDAVAALVGTAFWNGSSAVMDSLPIDVEDAEYSAILVVNVLAGIFTVISAAVEIAFIVQTLMKNKKFLFTFQISGIISVAAGFIGVIAVCMTYGRAPLGINYMRGLIGGIGGFSMLTLYFCQSVRVRAYMESDDYMAAALFMYEPKTSDIPQKYRDKPRQAKPRPVKRDAAPLTRESEPEVSAGRAPTLGSDAPTTYLGYDSHPQPLYSGADAPTTYIGREPPPIMDEAPLEKSSMAPESLPSEERGRRPDEYESPEDAYYDEDMTILLSETGEEIYVDMFCAHCGELFKEGESKCPKCGAERR